MDKTVTFSFNSTKYKGTEATETFTFKELGMDNDLEEEVLNVKMEEIFQAWVWDKLNIFYSIVISEENTHSIDNLK